MSDISLVEFGVMIRSSCNRASVSGCKGWNLISLASLDNRMKHELTGHAIDPDSLLHEGVLNDGHHAVGQKPISASTITSLTPINFSGDRAFDSSAPTKRQRARIQISEVQLKPTKVQRSKEEQQAHGDQCGGFVGTTNPIHGEK